MFIQTESTPNPSTLKFLPGRDVLGVGTANFPSVEEARGKSPLAEALFSVGGITQVFLGADFISVTKDEGREWQTLKPQILGSIMDHFTMGAPVMIGEADTEHTEDDGGHPEVVAQIKEPCWTSVFGRLWHRMAATSSSAALKRVWCIWLCRALAPAAPAQPRR